MLDLLVRSCLHLMLILLLLVFAYMLKAYVLVLLMLLSLRFMKIHVVSCQFAMIMRMSKAFKR